MAPRKRKPKTRGRRGDGSVWYVGEGRRKPWRATVLGRSQYFATEPEADAWRRRQLDGVSAPAVASDRLLVVDAIDRFLLERDWVAPTTKRIYTYYTNQIVIHLGHLAVGDVTRDHIGTMDRALRAKLVGKAAAYILGFCGSLFKQLLDDRVIALDPVASYRRRVPPRAREGRPMRVRRAVDAGVCRRILKELEGHPLRIAVAWLMVLGLRSGEMKGLRWANVRGGIAYIIEQRRENDRFTPAPIKTERVIGNGRAVPVPAALLALTPTGDDLVFPHPDGGSLSAKTLAEHLRRACLRVGVPHITPHQLRHTCATGLEALGCTRERRDALLGHAGKETGDDYTHIGVDTLRPWVERWAETIIGDAAQKLSSNVL